MLAERIGMTVKAKQEDLRTLAAFAASRITQKLHTITVLVRRQILFPFQW